MEWFRNIFGLNAPMSHPVPWDHKFDILAAYNTSKGYGAVHSETLQLEMAKLQWEYDKMMADWVEGEK